VTLCLTPPVSDQWLRPAEYWLSLHAATAKLDPLCGVISIAALDPLLASRVTVRIDSVEQLDYIDDIISPGARECSHVCLELDASWNPRVLGHLGTYRSPVFTVEDA